MKEYKLTVNGESCQAEVEEETPLLWVLRDTLGLIGTKFGCGIGQCGACTVHLDDKAIRSCSVPVSAVGNRKITTIEGLSKDDSLTRLQQAWVNLDVAQCGYCQSGQLMSASALLKSNPQPAQEAIDDAMEGNLCRCATYSRIRKAIQAAAQV